jgi:hypothetical protein|tara:strand:- start:463 stop:792 length:330 start_codon:yes stop_codon:yes gene_type:complete
MSKYVNLAIKNADTGERIYIKLFTNDKEFGDINEVLFKKVKMIVDTEGRNAQSFMGNSKYKNLNKEGKDFTINTKDTYEFSGWLKEDDYESKKKIDELKDVFNGNDKPF